MSLFCVEVLKLVCALPKLEEVVFISRLDAEFIGQGLFREDRVTRKLQGANSGLGLRHTTNVVSLRGASQAQFVIELESIVVFIVFDSTGGESPGEIVFDNIGLFPAVDQIHRVDQPEVGSNILSHGEARSGI